MQGVAKSAADGGGGGGLTTTTQIKSEIKFCLRNSNAKPLVSVRALARLLAIAEAAKTYVDTGDDETLILMVKRGEEEGLYDS